MNPKEFSRVNLLRCTSPEGFGHTLESWSEAEWTNASAGELGEACNLTKKILRHRDSVAGNHKLEDKSIESLRRRAAGEIADSIIYDDLAIQRLGFDTATVLRETFNAKSNELGCPILYEEEKGFIYLAGPYASPDAEIREERYPCAYGSRRSDDADRNSRVLSYYPLPCIGADEYFTNRLGLLANNG